MTNRVLPHLFPQIKDATTKSGYEALPEYPTALEPRTYTRWEMHDFARKAYDLGVRYIGGCCGTEPHHIRKVLLDPSVWVRALIVLSLT